MLVFEKLEPENIWNFYLERFMKQLIDYQNGNEYIFCLSTN